MPEAGLDPAILETKRQQTYALDRAATEIGLKRCNYKHLIMSFSI
jgi:hypothetical protein